MFSSEGQPTTIRPGCRFIHHVEHKCLMVVDELGKKMRWSGPQGDDKIIAGFVRDENDFRQFAIILADTHGLSLEVGQPCPAGPTIIFIEKKGLGPMRLQRQGEIALKLVKYFIRKRGIQFSQDTRREFGNIAKAIAVPFEELKQFAQPLFQEALDEYFITSSPKDQGGASSSLKG